MKGLINKTGLTGKELTVILFLLLTFAAGLIVKFSGWQNPGVFDYSESDSNFNHELKKDFKELGNEKLDSTQKKRLDELNRYEDSISGADERSGNKSTLKLPSQKININLALSGDLQQLPGIGEVMAERIIEYREQNGKFIKTDDLMKVKGIGEKKFEKIKDHIATD